MLPALNHVPDVTGPPPVGYYLREQCGTCGAMADETFRDPHAGIRGMCKPCMHIHCAEQLREHRAILTIEELDFYLTYA